MENSKSDALELTEFNLAKMNSEIQLDVDTHRTKVMRKITLESEALVDELLLIIHNHEIDMEGRPIVDAKIKLSAISMLLDRGIPKLGVEHVKTETLEESSTRKRFREEIEALVQSHTNIENDASQPE